MLPFHFGLGVVKHVTVIHVYPKQAPSEVNNEEHRVV